MIKKFLIILLLITFKASAQKDLVIDQVWSNPDKLSFNIGEGLHFTKIDGMFYAEFETLEDESVFYPDIQRSEIQAKFLEINKDNKLQVVSDSIFNKKLFLKTDFRTEWSEFIHVDRGYNSVKNEDGNWTHNWKVSCNYEGVTYTETFSYRSAPNRWYGVKSSLVSDESGLNAVFVGQTNLDGFFAKVIFIHFHPDLKRFEIIEKEIAYNEIGFHSNLIQPVTNYADHEFRLKDKPGLFFRFNLDNSSNLGLSTFLFDLTHDKVEIYSKQIDSTIFPILTDFNEVDSEIQVDGNSINYFVRLYRGKISQGNESNTNLSSESGEDVLYLKFEEGKYSEIQNFSDTRKTYHLLKTLRLNDEFIFIYDRYPKDIVYDKMIKIGNESKFKLWIVQFSNDLTTIYEIGFDYMKLNKSIKESYLSFTESDNSTIEIIVYLSGDMFEPTKDYLIGKINIR